VTTPEIVGVTGASGLIGSALVPFLTADGRRVIRLARPDRGEPLPPDLDAVVHLAGEPIASGRWNAAKKARIRQSRVEGTHALCQAIGRMVRPPQTLMCASAVGFYGNRGDALLDEDSPPGNGFLADVTQAWEAAAREAAGYGVRVVSLRFGMILSPTGGALARMLPPFAAGLGGRIGNGRQYWSWLSLDDALGAIRHALTTEALTGPVNAVAPESVTGAEFAAVLGRVLRRPAFLAVPALAARAIFGPMADEVLLAGARVMPRRLLETGYRFRHEKLETALRQLLTKS